MPARTTYKDQLVRTVAAPLRDPEREVAARATLRERFGAASGRGFKAARGLPTGARRPRSAP